MKTPDILNSKIKKIRIELPHYNFSHSSSGDSSHHFIGRTRTIEKLKKVIEDSPDEPGVYLIAGNRGIGKTSLISEIMKKTSFMPKSKFAENLRYLILLFLAVAGTQFCLQMFGVYEKPPIILEIVSFLIFISSFSRLCFSNGYRHKFPKKTSYIKCIKNAIISAFEELSYLNPYNSCKSTQIVLKTILVVSFTQIFFTKISPIKVFFGYLAIIFLRMCIDKYRKYIKEKNKISYVISQIFHDLILNPINDYIKNHNRLYLRINFGHKLKDEKDILRLVARTLSTEYKKYHNLFRRWFFWRTMAFSFLFFLTYLFSTFIEQQEYYQSIMSEERSGVGFPILDSKIKTTVETKADTIEDTTVKTTIKTKIDTKTNTKIGYFLHILDDIASEISKRTVKVPKYLFGNEGDINIDNSKILRIIFLRDYLFWLSFPLMYLFCILLFRCNLITHFFVTHRIIMRRLKKLNSDITYSTERENSISVNAESIGSKIGTKTKKSRNVADAREIEKELQDILDDMQRIPIVMCRPNIVIVFDELDKVESGDASLEKENIQTKASMFSINATRERQTEILRILSNLKYFLSTAKAKFIFIAGREMYDIHLADVSERNNYIGSIFNAVIYVPSFLTDHPVGRKLLPQESSIASLPEEFVCRRLIPYDYFVKSYDLKNYRAYLEKKIYKVIEDDKEKEKTRKEKVEKIIAVLQQFIIYLAHVSKGAPKKMMQLFESFVEIHIEKDENKSTLFVQRYHNSRHFLSFNYYKQYTLGIVAYLITPIFYRLSESNIKEHSDKLLVSALRFVDFVFKFHKHPFSYKHLDISPEMQEVNRAPELKSVAIDLLNYLAQVHINKSSFSLSEYKFDGLIANEIFAMAKTDDVFSALFSFSLDELSPLKNHYKDLLEKTEKKYRDDKDDKIPTKYIDAISSLQAVLGDLYYYDDGLEEAEAYYKNSVQAFREDKDNKDNEKIKFEQLYVYIRNMLRLGIIYEKRKQYDFAYLTYGELCKRIIASGQLYLKNNLPCINNNMSFEKTAYDGLKMLYLPFIAKLQILELSHIGGITRKHLEQLDKEFESLTDIIDLKDANLLEAELYSRVADILYYKNSDLKDLKCKKDRKNSSCTACDYYLKALAILLNKPDLNKPDKNTILKLLRASIEQIEDNYNMKFCTVLARILSDWGNVFFSCDTKNKNDGCGCNICNAKDCNTRKKCYHCSCYICDINDCNSNNLAAILKEYINYIESEPKNINAILDYFNNTINSNTNLTKLEITFAMYAISLHTYRKANLYKRSAYQIYKMLSLFKHYEIYKCIKSEDYIKQLSKKALNYLWRANENLGVFELNKRKKDFEKETIKDEDKIPLQNLLVDNEITRMRILVKELELKSIKQPGELKKFYDMRITSPYRINYSIVGRIYRLRLKSKVNYEAYQRLIPELKNLTEWIIKYNDGSGNKSDLKFQLDSLKAFYDKDNDKFIQISSEINYILENESCNKVTKDIFGEYFGIKQVEDVSTEKKRDILENLIAESIYCLTDIAQLLETMDETYLFPHSLLGSIHELLSFWIRLYETYEIGFYEKYKNVSRIKKLLKQYLDEEWREQLSGYRENKKALSHYYKCIEMHNEGRAYHNMIDTMCYVRDDYNDRSDHFNIAEERHLIVNKEIEKKINSIKNLYKDSKLYDVNNYFEKV